MSFLHSYSIKEFVKWLTLFKTYFIHLVTKEIHGYDGKRSWVHAILIHKDQPYMRFINCTLLLSWGKVTKEIQ